MAKAVGEKREARKMIEGIRGRREQPPTGLKYRVWGVEQDSMEVDGQSKGEYRRRTVSRA